MEDAILPSERPSVQNRYSRAVADRPNRSVECSACGRQTLRLLRLDEGVEHPDAELAGIAAAGRERPIDVRCTSSAISPVPSCAAVIGNVSSFLSRLSAVNAPIV